MATEYLPISSSKDPIYGCLFNMSRHSLTIGGEVYPTLEHAFQLSRYLPNVKDLGNLISSLKYVKDKIDVMNAFDAKRHIKRFMPNRFNTFVRDLSNQDVMNMEYLMHVKLSQHEEVQQALLKTGDKMIYEDVKDRHSFKDSSLFWGSVLTTYGMVGMNVFGELWEQHKSVISSRSMLKWYCQQV